MEIGGLSNRVIGCALEVLRDLRVLRGKNKIAL